MGADQPRPATGQPRPKHPGRVSAALRVNRERWGSQRVVDLPDDPADRELALAIIRALKAHRAAKADVDDLDREPLLQQQPTALDRQS
ncbi:MAG: hypothetical protein ACOYBP_09280 [Microbacteriaceae bacterium]